MAQPTGSQAAVSRTPTDALAGYAVRFHSALSAGHVAASPLGAYLLLAAVAPSVSGSLRAELERFLGCPADEALKFLSALLASPHPALTPAIAVWSDAHVVSEAFDRWRSTLPAGLETGPVPEQPAADAWTRRATREMIEHFPIQVDPRTMLLLASALAAEALWEEPFFVAPATALGSTPWAIEVGKVLMDYVPGEHVIIWTRSAGLVGALLSRTTEAQLVVSVIAEPTVVPHVAIAAAQEVAALVSGRASTAAHRSLFDLPLGAGHAWDIEETEIETHVHGERRERAQVLIPAWRAESSSIDLLGDAAFGFHAAVAALVECLPVIPEGYMAQAAQVTTARFDRYGFSAASVSALGMEMLGAPGKPRLPTAKGVLRTATVRFSRPFAVVAVAQSSRRAQLERGPAAGTPSGSHPWHGVPVFTAWVTRPTEPDVRESTGSMGFKASRGG